MAFYVQQLQIVSLEEILDTVWKTSIILQTILFTVFAEAD